jgi:hypothetical protein
MSMKKFLVLAAAVAFSGVGCSQAPVVREAPVTVTGKVSNGGLPVGDVMVLFHPLDHGHLGSFPVKPDGTFQGELVAGDYSYYLSQSTTSSSVAALKKVDPKYYEPNLERRISVAAGQEVLIALD